MVIAGNTGIGKCIQYLVIVLFGNTGKGKCMLYLVMVLFGNAGIEKCVLYLVMVLFGKTGTGEQESVPYILGIGTGKNAEIYCPRTVKI